MHQLVLFSLIAVALVPAASAVDPVCVSEIDTCASVASYDFGSCDDAASEYSESMRRVAVDSGSDHVAVQNYCYHYSFFGYTEDGSGIQVNYYRYDESTGEYRSAGVYWAGFTWNGGASCGIGAYSYGNDPLSVPVDPVECPAGEPGLIVPALP